MQEPPRGRNHRMRGWITAGLAQALDLLRLRGVCTALRSSRGTPAAPPTLTGILSFARISDQS